jgi:protein-S-isoprenylcysteine O-methyltransferase Ste14
MSSSEGRGPGVDIPPPFFFVAGFVVGWGLDRYVYHLFGPPSNPMADRVMIGGGVILLIAGLALAFSGIATFRRSKTSIVPNRDASRLVIAGPYRFTRNPMYSGLTIAYLGLSILLSTAWAVLLLPLVLLMMYRFVIAREERYLTAAFGDQYREYQARVGRWF